MAVKAGAKAVKAGAKFTERYALSSATVYKGNTDALKIPGPNHPLYDPSAPTVFDELRVQKIDADGQMTTPIEVWTDPDTNTLWVLDGRGRWLDVQEVNRRRKKEGRELVEPHITTFNVPGADEKRAIARMIEKNFHRRAPSISATAIGLLKLRNAGYTWEDCAASLHQEVEDAKQWGYRLLPVAFCIHEVQAAIDSGEIARGSARKFGGSKPDGSKALSKTAQLELLREMRGTKDGGGKKGGAQKGAVSPKARERATEALTNGATEKLDTFQKGIAKVIAATLARVGGDKKAFKAWPEVAAIFEEAIKPLPPGRPKKEHQQEAADCAAEAQ